ncbi:helix-turn-helix domain-containing protein [Corallococcus sp. AB049A]|uniref:helix-turn-helix domain-containing protein n=1 Tax=Corallococcus sp. AB049A TaxID=2316721 RepID=UPI000ED49D3B|nr:helix-turn-helix domain-containing protein [Corallococcus sp. AB049A]RKI70346.1 helix-turn-helix domain-containing protein [Corallococcus sp. AB049A]
MKPAIQSLLNSVQKALPDVSVQVDAPERTEGHWFLDFDSSGHKVTVEWHPSRGFGVSAALEDGYGEGPEEIFTDPEATSSRVIDLLSHRTYTRPPDAVLLRELRSLSRMTQAEIAQRLGIAQGAVSRMERRRDMSVLTLRRLIGAMGGQLDLVARFKDKSVRISQFNGEGDDARDEAACTHVANSLDSHEKSPAPPASDKSRLHAELTSWLDEIGELANEKIPLSIDIQNRNEALDYVCQSSHSWVTINPRLANIIATKTSTSLTQVCMSLLSHEAAHHLLDQQEGTPLGDSEAEMRADRLAGWIDGRKGKDPSIGGAVFYEMGCLLDQCKHPSPRSRLQSYLLGHHQGLKESERESSSAHTENQTWPPLPTNPPSHRETSTKTLSQARRSTDASCPDPNGVGLRYFVIRTPSLEKACDFYRILGLGLLEERHGKGPRHYAATLGRSVLELYPTEKRGQTARIGLGVQSISDIVGRVQASGFSSALVRCDDDKALLRDPDGNDIELVQEAWGIFSGADQERGP